MSKVVFDDGGNIILFLGLNNDEFVHNYSGFADEAARDWIEYQKDSDTRYWDGNEIDSDYGYTLEEYEEDSNCEVMNEKQIIDALEDDDFEYYGRNQEEFLNELKKIKGC